MIAEASADASRIPALAAERTTFGHNPAAFFGKLLVDSTH
jgi:hypothetical protein